MSAHTAVSNRITFVYSSFVLDGDGGVGGEFWVELVQTYSENVSPSPI